MHIVIHIATLAALTVTTASAAEVYKTVDAEGHVVYTDHADPNASKTAVQVNAVSAKQAVKNAKLQAAHRAEDLQHKKQQILEAAKIAQLDRDAKAQCDDAQKNFYAMKATALLSHQDNSGNPVNYSAAETAVKREEARQNMVLACTD